MAEWTGRLRRVLELFNRCLDACEEGEENEARIAMSEAFGKAFSLPQIRVPPF